MKIFYSVANIIDALILFAILTILFISFFDLIKEGGIKNFILIIEAMLGVMFVYKSLKDIEKEVY